METQAAAIEVTKIVWWSLILGGLTGGLARSLIAQRVELPYWSKDGGTGQIFIVPGFLGDLLLGPLAAILVVSLGMASTVEFQSGFEAKGFLAPFSSSFIAGAGASKIIQSFVDDSLRDIERRLEARVRALTGDSGGSSD